MSSLQSCPRRTLRWVCGLILSASLLLVIFLISNNRGAGSLAVTSVYLPLVIRPDPFVLNSPIWSHDGAPARHEVSFFRITFALAENLENAKLHIFADTRYEAWLDGVWVGRGPARFSQNYREYDLYQIGDLTPGQHLIAVLVQWAPNNRRSESVRPLLQAHIEGDSPSGRHTIVSTGSQWKSLLSPAWRTDAVLIQASGTIGPTELLDLGQLPADWFTPAFSDASWKYAVVVDPRQPFATSSLDQEDESILPPPAQGSETVYPIDYAPRSIAVLINHPVTITVLDSGLLSPGFSMGELLPTDTLPYNIDFQSTFPTTFTIETLIGSDPPPSTTILLDNSSLSWEAAGQPRPDVLTGSTLINPGAHTLSITSIPSPGSTFNLSTTGIQGINIPFRQGMHAGRRMLLARPVSNPSQVVVSYTPALTVEFNTLPAYIVFDLGRTTYGRLAADVTGPAGTVMDIGWDERLLAGTNRPLPYPGSLHDYAWNQVDSWVLDGSNRSVSTIDARTGRYILIEVWGSGPVTLQNVQVYEERYPLDQVGYFDSPDSMLNTIWQTGVTTVRLNMLDAYMDPWRERGQWWGDAYIDDHVNRLAFGDTSLLRRGALFMAEAFTPDHAPGLAPNEADSNMLDYAMLWVHSLVEYHQQTGDTQLLVNTYPALLQFMEHLSSYENPASGLIDLPKTIWWQTAYIEPMGYSSRYGQSTAVNAMYFGTLQQAAYIAEQVGDLGRQAGWLQKAEAVKTCLNTTLYLPDEGRYLTNIYQGAPTPPTPQAQAWALAYDLVQPGETESVVSALLELLSPDPANPNLEIYGMYWVLEALGHTGHISEGLDIITSYYGRLIDLGATTWWEKFTSDQFWSASLSHGWGSGPTWFLTTYYLGLRQTGQQSWTFIPSFAGRDYASGSLPLQDGLLQAAWQTQNCQQRMIDLSAPANTHGQVIIPISDATQAITQNGDLIWSRENRQNISASAVSEHVSINLPAGDYHFETLESCEVGP
jgi:Bacterial alpha-L-rhamnosidase 6 hairpin glycosidase domain